MNFIHQISNRIADMKDNASSSIAQSISRGPGERSALVAKSATLRAIDDLRPQRYISLDESLIREAANQGLIEEEIVKSYEDFSISEYIKQLCPSLDIESHAGQQFLNNVKVSFAEDCFTAEELEVRRTGVVTDVIKNVMSGMKSDVTDVRTVLSEMFYRQVRNAIFLGKLAVAIYLGYNLIERMYRHYLRQKRKNWLLKKGLEQEISIKCRCEEDLKANEIVCYGYDRRVGPVRHFYGVDMPITSGTNRILSESTRKQLSRNLLENLRSVSYNVTKPYTSLNGHKTSANIRYDCHEAVAKSIKDAGLKYGAVDGSKHRNVLFEAAEIKHPEKTHKDISYDWDYVDHLENFMESSEYANLKVHVIVDSEHWYENLIDSNLIILHPVAQAYDTPEHGITFDTEDLSFISDVRSGGSYRERPFDYRNGEIISDGRRNFMVRKFAHIGPTQITGLFFLGYATPSRHFAPAQDRILLAQKVESKFPTVVGKFLAGLYLIGLRVCHNIASFIYMDRTELALFNANYKSLKYSSEGTFSKDHVLRAGTYKYCHQAHVHLGMHTKVAPLRERLRPDKIIDLADGKRLVWIVHGEDASLFQSTGESMVLPVRLWNRLFSNSIYSIANATLIKNLKDFGLDDVIDAQSLSTVVVQLTDYQNLHGTISALQAKRQDFILPSCVDLQVQADTRRRYNHRLGIWYTIKDDHSKTKKEPNQEGESKSETETKENGKRPAPRQEDVAKAAKLGITDRLDLKSVNEAPLTQQEKRATFLSGTATGSNSKQIAYKPKWKPAPADVPICMEAQLDRFIPQCYSVTTPLVTHPHTTSPQCEEVVLDSVEKRVMNEDFTNRREKAMISRDCFDLMYDHVAECCATAGEVLIPANQFDIMSKMKAVGVKKVDGWKAIYDYDVRMQINRRLERPVNTEITFDDIRPLKLEGFLKIEATKAGPARIIIDSPGAMRKNAVEFAYGLMQSAEHNKRNLSGYNKKQYAKAIMIAKSKFTHCTEADLSKWDAHINLCHVIYQYMYMMRAYGLPFAKPKKLKKCRSVASADGVIKSWMLSEFDRAEQAVEENELFTGAIQLHRNICAHILCMSKKYYVFYGKDYTLKFPVLTGTQISGDFLTYFFNTKWNEMMNWIWAKRQNMLYGRDYVFIASGDDSLLFTNALTKEELEDIYYVYEEMFSMKLSRDDTRYYKMVEHEQINFCGAIMPLHLDVLIPDYKRWMPKYHITSCANPDAAWTMYSRRAIKLLGLMCNASNSFMGSVIEKELTYYLSQERIRAALKAKVSPDTLDRDDVYKLCAESEYTVEDLGSNMCATIEKALKKMKSERNELAYRHDVAYIESDFSPGICERYLEAIDGRDPRKWPVYFPNTLGSKGKDYRRVMDDEWRK